MEPSVTVNGRPRELGPVGGHVTLLGWLRSVGLTGSKEGCAEGECGACAVLVSRPDGEQHSRWTAINACLVPAAGYVGQEVLTAEGLGTPDALHPVQQEMADRGGSQCGYCTPGFVCAMAGEYYRPDRTPTGRTERVAAAEPDTDGDAATRGPGGNGQTDPDHPRHGRGPRAWPQRLRPARPQRQPVPLHRLPAHPRRGVRAAGPRAYRPAARPLRPSRAAPGGHPDRERRRRLRPAGDPGRGPRAARRRARRATRRRLHRLGRRAQPPARPGALSIGIDRLPELRTWTSPTSGSTIGAALTLSEIERGLAGRVPLLDAAVPAVRVPADPQRRHPGRQPGHRLPDRRRHRRRCWRSTRRWSWPRATASARCRWRTSSPATGSPSSAPAS